MALAGEENPRVRVLYDAAAVETRIDEMGREIVDTYPDDEQPILVALLHGSMPFAIELMRGITRHAALQERPAFDPVLATMIVSTYRDGENLGEPRIVTDLPPSIKVAGRLILLVDDLVDTGTTMAFTEQHMYARGAAGVHSAALLQKEGNPRPLYPHLTFHGFKSPFGQWLFGMGMDGDPRRPKGSQAARWLREIMIKE